MAYQAMEVLQEGRVTRASDVYSFAMVMLELITGERVFDGFTSSQVRALFKTLLTSIGMKNDDVIPGCSAAAVVPLCILGMSFCIRHDGELAGLWPETVTVSSA